MDNLCHTLAGAAFGEAGLKKSTRFGNPVLMVAANLPDVDVVAFATDTPWVAIRRGWTHGILAQALLPIAFTALVLLFDRLRPPRQAGAPRARARALLLLSYIGVISHVLLDCLNTYGVRLLMPFSHRWFYGDAVFIADPWLWLVLGAGVYLARRHLVSAPARTALAIAGIYIAVMIWSALAARQIVLERWMQDHGTPPRALMVGPAPIDPFRKVIIADAGDHYETGTFRWWSRRVLLDDEIVRKLDQDPVVVRARESRTFRSILVWARFPYYQVAPVHAGTRVSLRDLRFGARIGAASVVVAD